MKPHNPELIGALLDGELKGLRRWRMRRHVGRCAACATEYRHLQRVRLMLADNELQPQMSDSADFFWSKVRREIQANEGRQLSVPMPRLSLSDWLGQRRLAFAGAGSVVLMAVALVIALNLHRTASLPPLANTIAKVDSALPNATATTFTAPDGDAVIWVSGLPWSKDMNEMQTTFASL